MESAIFSSVVAAASALLGVAITSFFQLRKQKNDQRFQSELEIYKRKTEIIENDRIKSLERIEKAHRLLSLIAREFSITKLEIDWHAEIADSEYSVQYLELCLKADELRVVADIYEVSLSEEVKELYGKMNIYWGSFKIILYRTTQGDKIDTISRSTSFQNAHEAARSIEKKASNLKVKLADISKKYQNNG